MGNVIGTAFGVVLSIVIAVSHHAAFRDPNANAATRLIDRWYARWWQSAEDRHGMLGFMSAGYLFMAVFFIGALIWEITKR